MLPYYLAKMSLFIFALGTPGQACNLPHGGFFFLPPWWEYLKGQYDQLGDCAPVLNLSSNPTQFWLIGMAALDALLRVAGFLAVVSIMLAGAQLVFTEGNPEKATSARNRLINSLIGLAIAVSATALVALAGNVIGGGATASGVPQVSATNGTIKDIFNVAFVILGALAFLFTVIAGFRYVLAGGNSDKTAEARRQIIYAALGLLLLSLASTFVNFVLGKIS